jgi:hypothetical protein
MTAVLGSVSPTSLGQDKRAQFLSPWIPRTYTADEGSSNVTGLATNGGGLLSSLISSPYAAGNAPFWITTDPSGKFVLIANVGSNSIITYKLNAGSGALTSNPPITAGSASVSSSYSRRQVTEGSQGERLMHARSFELWFHYRGRRSAGLRQRIAAALIVEHLHPSATTVRNSSTSAPARAVAATCFPVLVSHSKELNGVGDGNRILTRAANKELNRARSAKLVLVSRCKNGN